MFEWKTFFNDFAEEYYSVPYLDKKEHIYALQNYLIAKGMLVEDVDYAIKTLLGEETPVNSWSDRKTHKEEERKRVAEEKPKYAKASGGKYYVKNKETGNVYSVVKPNPEKHDPISREKAEKEVEKDGGGKEDKAQSFAREKFKKALDHQMSTIEFEPESDKEVFQKVIDKVSNQDANFSDEEKKIAGKYIAKSDSDKTAKLYIAKVGPQTFDDKARRGQVNYAKSKAGRQYIDKLQKVLNLPTTAAQAKKTDAGRVASKIRTKDISPTDINKEIEVGVSRVKDSKGNITAVKFGNKEHKLASVPDKQKLKQTFMDKGMSDEQAELRAKKVRRSIRKHNEYLVDLTQTLDKESGEFVPRKNFKVASMIKGADPSTEEGRQKILEEYPKKIHRIFKDIVAKSPGGITEDEKRALNTLRDLNSNLSTEEYEKECLNVIHTILRTPSLASGGADLAESITGLIQTKKGHEIYFPSDVTYKVGDMISLGDLGDLNPTDPDYYNKVADAASSIIVTVEAEGPASVKVGAGAASSAEEKVRMTEYENPKTRSALSGLVSTHKLMFDKPQDLNKADENIQKARDHALSIGITQEELDKIDEKAKAQSAKWKELWKGRAKKGTEDWSDEDWDKMEQTLVRFAQSHLLIQDINNKDMIYQKFTNYRYNDKVSGTEVDRTDGVNCLGSIKAAMNMGFTWSEGGGVRPQNTFSSRIGNTCKDVKK